MMEKGKYIRHTKGKATIDKVGIKFNLLTVVKEIGYLEKDNCRDKKIFWLCRCECGGEVIIAGCKIGKQKSCGCLLRRIGGYKKYEDGKNVHHGESKIIKGQVSEYRTWLAIKARCYKVNHVKYPKYGGKGVTVCDRWKYSYQNFLEDMGRRPSNKSSIDRIDNKGNYESNNCRWSTPIQQMNNTSRNVFIEYKDQSLTVAQWSRQLKIPYSTLHIKYFKKGLSMEQIQSTYT